MNPYSHSPQVSVKSLLEAVTQEVPVVKEEDSIEQMMKHFSAGLHNVAIVNGKGFITHLVSQWLFISFLDTNLHTDWFPSLLNAPILDLHIIIPRCAHALDPCTHTHTTIESFALRGKQG